MRWWSVAGDDIPGSGMRKEKAPRMGRDKLLRQCENIRVGDDDSYFIIPSMLRFLALILVFTSSMGLRAGSWNEQFVPPPGVAGEVTRMVAYGSDIIVGGHFVSAGGVAATNLARWDGTNWHQFGGGVNGYVLSLAVSGTNLYVGGLFGRAGTTPSENLAVWNGTAWRNIGDVSGTDENSPGSPLVLTILPATNGIYIAGIFREVNGVAATNVAFWDGADWHSLGSGIANEGGDVRALSMYRGHLYAAGIFRDANRLPRSNIAQWNGEEWLPLRGGVTEGDAAIAIMGELHSGVVNTLSVHRNKLIVGGNFFRAGQRRANGFAAWNGRRWINIGRGVVGSSRTINHLEPAGQNLFVCGGFTRFNGRARTHLASWPFSGRLEVRRGPHAGVTAMAITERGLFIGGEHGLADETRAANVGRWDGQRWRGVGEGTGNAPLRFPQTVAASGSNVFVAGQFVNIAGTNRVERVARWDGQAWHRLGGGIPGGDLRTSAADGSNFYVGGFFSLPESGITNLARWDGLRWRSLGNLFNENYLLPGDLASLTFGGGKLFAAGHFTSIDGVLAKNIACWDGTNWSALGDGLLMPVQPQSFADVMVYHAGSLYILADIPSPFSNPLAGVWRWDGLNWSVLAQYPRYHGVAAGLAVFRDELYVAGVFSEFDGVLAENLAKWNGTNWAAVGSVPTIADARVSLITATPNGLYLAGEFSTFAGVPAQSVIRWDGVSWSALGDGLRAHGSYAQPFDAAATEYSVFFVGPMDTADGKSSHNIAEWRE